MGGDSNFNDSDQATDRRKGGGVFPHPTQSQQHTPRPSTIEGPSVALTRARIERRRNSATTSPMLCFDAFHMQIRYTAKGRGRLRDVLRW